MVECHRIDHGPDALQMLQPMMVFSKSPLEKLRTKLKMD